MTPGKIAAQCCHGCLAAYRLVSAVVPPPHPVSPAQHSPTLGSPPAPSPSPQPTASTVLGANYEGHKVTLHALSLGSRCVLNLQFAMDAPFQGQVADETRRARGRSEASFPGFDPSRMQRGLTQAVAGLASECQRLGVGRVVVQIARGRSAAEFQRDVLAPVLAECGLSCEVRHGYRSTSWPQPPPVAPLTEGTDEPFAFLNIGMFARLTEGVLPGQAFACVEGVAVQRGQDGRLEVIPAPRSQEVKMGQGQGQRGVGVVLDAGLPLVELVGIGDDMPFITPEHYTEQELLALFSREPPRGEDSVSVSPWPRWLTRWEYFGEPKITLKAPSEKMLKKLYAAAIGAGLPAVIIQDAGHTQIAPGSRTVCAIGPAPASSIDAITGQLSLF